MTTPAPASPLPFKYTVRDDGKGRTFVEVLDAQGQDIFDSIDCDKRMYGEPADAAYIVHAANTLPKVEAERDRLRAVLRECAPLVKTAAVRDRAYAALREAKP